MEAVTVLGVAGNVLQFLDFGQKLYATSLEIYRTATGASAANAASESLLRDFIESIDTIASDLQRYQSSLDATASQVSQKGTGGLQDVVEGCKSLAVELLDRFEKLRAHGAHKRWKSVITAVKCMWKEKELQDLQSRLGQYRSQLEWRVLTSLRESVDLLVSRQEDQFTKLQTAVTQRLTDVIQEQMLTLPRWPAVIEDSVQQSREKTMADIAAQQDQARRQTDEASRPLKSNIKDSKALRYRSPEEEAESFVDEYAQEYATKLAEIEADVWESLSFPVMMDREDDISQAELNTFDWILEEPRNHERPWDNFLDWLLTGEGLYWISGKAGSGKSTLVKHLSNHPRCHQALETWAGQTPLVTASFFFWYSGSELQKSQIGRLRALLYQCLTDHRELIPMVLADTARMESSVLSKHWSLPRLKTAFIKLLEQKSVPLKICLFVDGLDEYKGAHSEIAELFEFVARFEHVKVCVSSRPLIVFDRALKQFPGLLLQNLTFDDINTYVRNRLGTHERMRELAYEEPELAPRLTSEIVNKASGVFLWVKLVVYSLLEGLGNYDRGADLERRLEELPEDIEDLYWHIIDRVTPNWYLEETFRLLLIVKNAFPTLSVLQLCFADTQDPQLALKSKRNEISAEMQLRQCENMVGRIKSRCLGLIEVTGSSNTNLCSRRVQFLHKTVSDFLATPKAQSRITECLGGEQFFAELHLMRSSLLELKTVETRLSESDLPDGLGLKREAWFEYVKPIVIDFMYYAGYAEDAMNTAQVALIDEIEKTTNALWDLVDFRSAAEREGRIHWHRALRKPGSSMARHPLRVYSDPRSSERERTYTKAVSSQDEQDPAASDPHSDDRFNERTIVRFDPHETFADPFSAQRVSNHEHADSQRMRQLERPSARYSGLLSKAQNHMGDPSCGFEAFARHYRLDLYVAAKYCAPKTDPSLQVPHTSDGEKQNKRRSRFFRSLRIFLRKEQLRELRLLEHDK